jgi:hypothetical protein
VDRTKWHPDSDRRTATIRLGSRARSIEVSEGQKVGELTVGEIKPSSVVFLFEGERFDRKVGR